MVSSARICKGAAAERRSKLNELIGRKMERTLTLTMEDALISKMGIAILTGAGLIDATSGEPVPVHFTETVVCKTQGELTVKYEVFDQASTDVDIWIGMLDDEGNSTGEFIEGAKGESSNVVTGEGIAVGKGYIVDYYTAGTTGITEIDIEPNKFGGNYYLEGSTLFRNTSGVDMPAEFIVPNCKIQSNFTFTMASSGDPSTFTYTVDAFPGVTKHNPAKKVLCAIYMVETMPEEVKAIQGEQ